MPSETVDADCVATKEVSEGAFTEVGTQKSHDKQRVKEERDVEGAHAEDSMLYALATAAASRSTTPNFAVKQEARSPSSEEAPREPRPSESSVKHEKRTPSPEFDCNRLDSVYATDGRKRNGDPTTSKERFREVDVHGLTEPHGAFLAPSQEDMSTAAKHANQLHLMEAMMQRQRQLYEEYGQNNWMKLQRNDSNCLSKSKAKRYRWCVQKQQEEDCVRDSVVNAVGVHSTVDYSSASSKKKLPTKRPVNPMHDKLYGTVFTGASKFRCRDCGKSFTTLVDLTVHMNKTGHYRDQNIPEAKGRCDPNKFAKPKKRSMMEMEEKESAEKVLKCLGCGHSFDSLQDLTVHMIKTKHYEDVPSLRLYGQKSDFCATAGGMTRVSSDEKPTSTPLRFGNSMASEFSISDGVDGMKYPHNGHNPALNFFPPGAGTNAFGGHTNFSNMLSLAALRLLGFPPYFMQMSFPNAMSGYDMASAAYAAATARLFLSSPWLAQMPALSAGGMFPPFLSPHNPLPPGALPHSRQPSPTAGDIPARPTPTRSVSSSTKSAHRLSPSEARTPNGCKDDLLSSKSHILRCVQCGENFTSLQKMTDHMRETTHFPIAMTPPVEESNHRRGSRCSSASDSFLRSSPRPKGSPHRPTATPTSSPLEQLAKLACGKSLGESNGPRPKPNGSESLSKITAIRGSPDSPGNKLTSSNHSLSGERYIRPDSPREASDTPVTGFDFIKSLETTIQSAISRVNQPARSPSSERQSQAPHAEEPRLQKSRKHRILNSFLPEAPRQHRKSFPDNSHCGGSMVKHEKALNKRPASDGEEYYRKEPYLETPKKKTYDTTQRKYNSPPLDLSKTQTSGNEVQEGKLPDKNAPPVTKTQTDQSSEEENAPIQPSEDNMPSSFHSNARKRWEKKKHASPDSPTRPHDTKRHDGDTVSEEHTSDGLGTNPLKEMQKIINATEISLNEGRSPFSTSRNSRKRGMGGEAFKQERPAKAYKPSSVLSDLVRHNDDDSPPAVDPLAQMEHLVNLKIGTNLSADKSPSNAHSKKPNLARPYAPLRPEQTKPPRNGTNPMSALLSLFSQNGGESLKSFSRAKDVERVSRGVEPKCAETRKSGKQNSKPTSSRDVGESNGDVCDDSSRLKEKMTEFFRSMIAQGQPLLSKSHAGKADLSTHAKACANLKGLCQLEEIKLQKLFTSHFKDNAKSVEIPDPDLRALSEEISLSTEDIKEWISSTKKQLMEKGRCSFIHLSESDAALVFRCTSCSAKSTQALSARDFLHHLSTHISDEPGPKATKRRSSHEERKKDWEMLYRGAMRFRSLKAEDGPPSFSLTATVSESPVEPEYSTSSKRVEVHDDSPIKVSG